MIVFQLACPLAIAMQHQDLDTGPYAAHSDAARYRAIAVTPGRPYRDFQVEYPPVAVGLFHGLGPHDFGGFRQRLFALQVACQALIVLLLFKVWGTRAGWSYLALSTPMLFVVYPGFDLVAVALAVSGAALVRRRRPAAGALAFVAGAFTKLWPVALLPVLLVRRRARAFAVGIGAGGAGLLAWSWWGGARGVVEVVTNRGARGWEYESVPGALLRLATNDRLHFSRGAWRVGAPAAVFMILMSALLVVAVAAVWRLAWRRPRLPEGLAETAAITALLTVGTLLSPQFLIWPLPFVAIAAANGVRRLEPWAGAAAVLTGLESLSFDPYHPARFATEVAILGRNVALIGLFVVAIVEIRRAAPVGPPAPPAASPPNVPAAIGRR